MWGTFWWSTSASRTSSDDAGPAGGLQALAIARAVTCLDFRVDAPFSVNDPRSHLTSGADTASAPSAAMMLDGSHPPAKTLGARGDKNSWWQPVPQLVRGGGCHEGRSPERARTLVLMLSVNMSPAYLDVMNMAAVDLVNVGSSSN